MASDSPSHSSSTSGRMVARIRSAMEILALAMIVAVCGFMIAAITRGTWVATPAPSCTGCCRGPEARPEPAVPDDPVSLDGANLDGPRSATVAVIEFSDFQCPYCGRFARETWPSIRKSYVETGKVLFAFREFPLESIHKAALQAAEAAECAGEQNSFWKMHDLMFADQAHLDVPALVARAHDSGLDVAQFSKCLASSVDARVKADEKTGVSLAVAGTPTFFLGRIQADGRVKVACRFSGALPVADFGAAVDALL